jgi:hypothetical protein
MYIAILPARSLANSQFHVIYIARNPSILILRNRLKLELTSQTRVYDLSAEL